MTASSANNTPKMYPVAATFDILPQVRNAIVVYKIVRSKFKIFRHYSSEIDRIRKLFSAQRGCFLNEVELLLRLVVDDPSIIVDMMRNPDNGQWDGYTSGMNVKAVFGRNLSLLRDVVDDVAASIAALQNAFQCFLPLEQEQERVRNYHMDISVGPLELTTILRMKTSSRSL